MSRMPLVVSHYTASTGYENEVKNLIDSLISLKLDYEITPIKSLGSWRANSNYCAQHIRDMLIKHPDRDILRVDADAVFQARPVLFEQDDFNADIAACVYDFWYRPNEFLGGTLFFRNTEYVKELVNHWVTVACKSARNTERNGDLLQEILQYIEFRNINFESLPPSYCKIFDRMKDGNPPVIEHFQASRRFKRIVNAEGRRTRASGIS